MQLEWACLGSTDRSPLWDATAPGPPDATGGNRYPYPNPHEEIPRMTYVTGGAGNDVLNGGDGDDVLDGRSGNDSLQGGLGNDILIGGSGSDLITGGRGNDIAHMGSGNDVFVWNPGDGTDSVDGGAGIDRLEFNGSNVGEIINIGAAGNHALLSRNVGSIAMDLDNVEHIKIRALGDSDQITIDDLRQTDVKRVTVDLAGFNNAGDGAADDVIANGTSGNNTITLRSVGTAIEVDRFGATLRVENGEIGVDHVIVRAQGGDDTIDAGGVAAGLVGIVLDGGDGNDTLHGGAGNDTLLGGNDDDRFLWHQGDGVDVVDGGSGNDVLEVSGTMGGDVFQIVANGLGGVLVAKEGGALANVSATNVEEVKIIGKAGDDVFNATGNIAAIAHLILDGGAGNDVINGGNGNDLLIGGDGNDIIDGNQGSDIVRMGSGNDAFNWDPGDGSDQVDGGSGNDLIRFNGANIGEIITLGANGDHATLTRNVANITLDIDNVENVIIRTFGGADTITIGDMRGTELRHVTVDLAASNGQGDGAADEVNVAGSAGNDSLRFEMVGGVLEAIGRGVRVRVENAETGTDHFALRGLDGNDTLEAKTVPAGTIGLILDGGNGNDTLHGGAGNDTLLGGADDDRVTWGHGDGTDTVDGGTGNDVLEVRGTDSGDVFQIAANGLGGVIVVEDGGQPAGVTATAVEEIALIGGVGNDVFSATGNIAALTHLTFDGGAGNDHISGGNGNDTLIGGDGDDVIDGNQGSDTAFMGAGTDTFIWDPGDGSDFVDGGTGTDVLLFNGSNIGEDIVIGASGDHALLTRNVASIAMDLDNVERLEVSVFGGADHVTVNAMDGTDVKTVAVGFAATLSGGDDGAIDTLTVNATSGNDVIKLETVGGVTHITGLHAEVQLFSATAQDRLEVNGLGGNDTIDARNHTGAVGLTLNGGAGDDTLIGGDDDHLIGGSGNDTFLGFGDVIVDDFQGGDRIDLSNIGGLDFDAVMAHAHNVGSDIVLDFGTDHTITLRNVQAESLTGDDFLF
jgi:Ca2+-binding RTX toxin-like protein